MFLYTPQPWPMTRLSRRRLHDLFCHYLQCVDVENAFHPGQQTIQQPEVAVRDANGGAVLGAVERGHRFSEPRFWTVSKLAAPIPYSPADSDGIEGVDGMSPLIAIRLKAPCCRLGGNAMDRDACVALFPITAVIEGVMR